MRTWNMLKPRSILSKIYFQVNHGVVFISGVKLPVIFYLISAEAICGLILQKRSLDTSYKRYLKHDEPSHIRGTNTLITTNQPRGRKCQFFFDSTPNTHGVKKHEKPAPFAPKQHE